MFIHICFVYMLHVIVRARAKRLYDRETITHALVCATEPSAYAQHSRNARQRFVRSLHHHHRQ